MPSSYQQLQLATGESFELLDITAEVTALVAACGISEGLVAMSSLHTTCALTVNEDEARLRDDIRDYFLRLAPPDAPYKHNDLHLRENIPPDEPENAHAHLIAMLLGNSETVAVHEGGLVLGQYQSILLVELDGPRERSVSVQILGRGLIRLLP